MNDLQARNILNSLIQDSNRHDQTEYEQNIDAFERAVVMLALQYENPTKSINYINAWFDLVDLYIKPWQHLLDSETAQRLGIEEWITKG